MIQFLFLNSNNFDYEEIVKLRPLIEEGTQALMSQDMNFNNFLVEWDEMRKTL